MFCTTGNGIITICRGDSQNFPLFINCGSKMRPARYNFGKNQDTEVYIGVMEPNQRFEEAVIKKRYFKDNWTFTKDGDLVIKFEPNDTLFLSPGKYYYQVKVVLPDGSVDSLMPKRQFIILE